MSANALPLPPPLPGSPLVGNALQMMRDPVALLARGQRELGNLFSLKLGPQLAVILLGPENGKVFFEQTDKLLDIREAYPFFKKMFSDRLYFMAKPAEYREQRAVILPKFQGKAMDSYAGVMVEETRAFLDKLGDSGTFDLTPTLGPVVMNIAAAAFLGRDFRHKLGEEFFGVFRNFSGGMEPILPLWLPLPRLLRSKRARKQIHAMLQALIDRRRAEPVEPKDFLQLLIETRYSDGVTPPDQVLIDLILLLVWAGHETTAGHISWGLADLIANPDQLALVRQEADELLGQEGPVDLGQIKSLKRIEWALKETERLHPVAFILYRVAAQDLEVSGHRIPKGAAVLVAPAVSHRMPEVFKNPERYDPERFSPERAEDRVPYSLIGFGGATHRCAGVNFAYQEMKIVLSLLVQRYEVELLDSPRPAAGMVTKWPASPCRVRYRLRKDARVAKPVQSTRAAADEAPVEKSAVGSDAAARCPFHALFATSR